VKKQKLFTAIAQRIANLTIKERIIFIVSSIVLVFGILGGLVSFSNKFATRIPISGGTYHEGIVGSPRFINPVLASSDADRDLTILIYSGLVRLGAEGEIIPDLASSWAVSDDGKTYSFTLREHITFHDGTAITPEDIIFTIQKIQDPTLKSPLRVAWDGVSVSSPDEKTITFSLQKPYAGFLNQLTLGIVPSHLWKNVPIESWQTSTLNTEPIGSGPYQLSKVSRNHTGVPKEYQLKAFPQFALSKPFIKNITIAIYANKSDAEIGFKNNSLDGLAMIDSGDVDSIISKNDVVISKPLPRVFGLFFNPAKNKLFADPTIIKALNLAIDKKSLIDQIFKGYGTALNGPLPQSIDTGTADIATRQKLASDLLDRAGWKINETTGIREKTTSSSSGTGKKTTVQTSKQILKFTLSTTSAPDLKESAELIVEQYKKMGIQVDLKIFEIGTFNENVIRGRDFEGILFGQVIKHDTDVFAFWHSSQRISPGLNITGYANKQVDSLLELATKQSDPKKRGAAYKALSDQLAKDAPVVFLYTPDYVQLMNHRIYNPITPTITTPSDRFSLIYQWYIETDRVWNTFLTK
jgi:peptide/nickel transport system substrate-binding protein